MKVLSAFLLLWGDSHAENVKPGAQMPCFLIRVLEGKEFVPSEDKCIFCPGGGQGYVHCVVLTAIRFPIWIPHWPP